MDTWELRSRFDEGQATIEGSRDDLRLLGACLREPLSRVLPLLVSGDPPGLWCGWLTRIDVRPNARHRLLIEREGDALVICGDLETLAEYIDFLADQAGPGHSHLEYWPGNDSLDERSVPLMIEWA